jgi:hypothetical protein
MSYNLPILDEWIGRAEAMKIIIKSVGLVQYNPNGIFGLTAFFVKKGFNNV